MWGDFYMVVIPLLAGYVLDSFFGDPRRSTPSGCRFRSSDCFCGKEMEQRKRTPLERMRNSFPVSTGYRSCLLGG